MARPNPDLIPVTIYLPRDEYEWLRDVATREERSLSWVGRQFISQAWRAAGEDAD